MSIEQQTLTALSRQKPRCGRLDTLSAKVSNTSMGKTPSTYSALHTANAFQGSRMHPSLLAVLFMSMDHLSNLRPCRIRGTV